jgi:hypothetical protein
VLPRVACTANPETGGAERLLGGDLGSSAQMHLDSASAA